MMKIVRATLLFLAAFALLPSAAHAQLASQQVLTEGLLTHNHHGSFTASAFAPDGSLYLLLDEGDGIRVLKSDSSGSNPKAQIHLGAAGDSPVAIAVDPGGNIYITGTSTSGTLAGTAGVPFPAPSDKTTNSFVAKLDAELNLLFLTFTGSGHTAASSIAANAQGVYVSGSIFSNTLPVTPSAVMQTPATASNTNGFVECFSADGSKLIYATYLTGVNGDTEPAAIATDPAGHAIIGGETSSAGYPTFNALQPATAGSTSGFLTELTPAGDGIVYSTFIAGAGITSIAFDSAASSLLLTGTVALGQFPVAITNSPLTSATYQSLLQLSLNGQSVMNSVLLAPGTRSSVAAAPDGSAWVTLQLSTPLLPPTIAASSESGDSLLLHVLANGSFAQSLRVGGNSVGQASYASLTTALGAPALSPDGSRVAAAGTATVRLNSSLLATQHFDLATTPPTTLLPSSIEDIVPDLTACGSSNECIGTGALLAELDPTSSTPGLTLSTGDLPSVTLANPGSALASSVSVSATGYTLATDCSSSLGSGAQCGILLSGAGPGSLTVAASGIAPLTFALPQSASPADPLTLSASELDFGIVTSGAPATRILTLTNLSSTAQTFTTSIDAGPSITPYTLAIASSTCAPLSTNQYTIPPNASCALTFSLAASSSSSNDRAVRSVWKIGAHDLTLTGFSQAAALSLSASELDFGEQSPLPSAPRLPRYLFLSNNSQAAVAHSPAMLPSGSPFHVTDGCPSTLQPHSVCRITVTYVSATAPSVDSATLNLDQSLAVLLTAQTLSLESVSGSSADPNVTVSPASITFPGTVTVTELSSSPQIVQITNSGPTAVSITPVISGDFALQNQCAAAVPSGSSCDLLITFAPSQPGIREGLLSVSAGSGFSPTTVMLSGSASAILPANNGTLALGTTNAGEPIVQWYPIQAVLPSVTLTSSNPAFSIAVVANSGSTEPPSLPSSSFASTATAVCANCWLGIQFVSPTPGSQTGTLSLSTVPGGTPEHVAITASATAASGLLLTPASQDFGAVPLHSSTAPLTFTLTNLLSSAASANIQSISASGDFTILPASTGDCSGALPATAACTIEVIFAPTAQGSRTGTLTITTDSGTVTSTLTGTGTSDPGLALQPTSLIFNNQAGTAATQQTVTVVNTSASSVTIGSPAIANTSFAATTNCAALAPSTQCTVTVTFTPGTTLPQSTLILPVALGSGAQQTVTTYTVPLSGTYSSSSAGLVITPSESNLGSFATGAPGSSRQFTVTNVTSSPLAIGITPPRQFPITATGCATLASNASCTFTVELLPAINGPLTGSVQITGTPASGTPLASLAYLLGYGQGSGALTITGAASPLSFGDVASGQTAQQTLTLTNSGTGALTIHRITTQPPFIATTTCGRTLSPAATCSVTITYAPVYELTPASTSSALRQDTAPLTIESDAISSPDLITLAGTATAVTAAQPSAPPALASYTLFSGALTFPTTQVGNISPAQMLTLTNNGSTTLHIHSILAPADFTASSTCSTLIPGASCSITVQFTPTDLSAQSVRTGTLEIQSDASDALEFVTLLGSSTPASLSFSASTLDFGSIIVGATAQLAVTATNTGSSAITLGALSATGAYAASSGTCPASGGALAAGAQCTLTITFAPTASGPQTGLLSLSSSATQLPLTIAMTGVATGSTSPQTPSFTLTVNGATTASLTVASGQPASFTLSLTPANAFAGPVALTCNPLGSAPYASCSLLASTLTLGTGPQSSTATINTLTSTPQAAVRLAGILLLPIFTIFAVRLTRRRGSLTGLALALFIAVSVASLSGCGSAPRQTATSNLLYTPAGNYQWMVTASSTSGTPLSSSVVLTVTVK